MSEITSFTMELVSDMQQTRDDVLDIGDYDRESLRLRDKGWDQLDIFSVTIDEGIAVYLYPKDLFQGDPWILRQSTDEKIIRYNSASFSIKVINTNAIRIYPQINYTGVAEEVSVVEERNIDNITVRSMLIPAGMIVTYYQGGVFKLLWKDTPDFDVLSEEFIPDGGIITVKELSEAIGAPNANNIDNWEKIKTIFSITSS